jgi:hypothetical protein
MGAVQERGGLCHNLAQHGFHILTIEQVKRDLVQYRKIFILMLKAFLQLLLRRNIPRSNDLANAAPASVSQWGKSQFEMALPYAFTNRNFILYFLNIAITLKQLRPGFEDVRRCPANHLRSGYTNHTLRGRVYIGDTIPRVQYKQAIAHVIHHKVTGDGCKVNQMEPKDAPGKHGNGDGESEGSQIKIWDGTIAAHVEDVCDPWSQDGNDQSEDLSTIQALFAE